jgi:hypothetical protein
MWVRFVPQYPLQYLLAPLDALNSTRPSYPKNGADAPILANNGVNDLSFTLFQDSYGPGRTLTVAAVNKNLDGVMMVDFLSELG